jgi:hypothetical protein
MDPGVQPIPETGGYTAGIHGGFRLKWQPADLAALKGMLADGVPARSSIEAGDE